MTTDTKDAFAQNHADPAARRVLDIEKRQVVLSERFPSNAGPTCDVLIVGGGLGGVAAAEAAARSGMRVILTEPTRMLGGQLTSQAVSVPDENSHIEKPNGPSTRRYRELREQVRAHYGAVPGIKAGREKNVGACWVSRVSGTPLVWESAIRERLAPLVASGSVEAILTRHQLRGVSRLANGRVNYADFVNLDTGKVVRIGARFLLDATEDGDALVKAGAPTVVGQEAQAEYGEPNAPPVAHPEWIQSFTYCFALSWQADTSQQVIAQKPDEYDYFKSLGEYTLDYVYSDARGIVPYKVLEKAPNAGGPFWTYRRLVASSSFTGAPESPVGDLALMNWRGNDFHEEPYLDKPVDEQARILERGKAFAQGFLYWLQTECPRDDGSGNGYPEMQLDTGSFGGGDGFGLHPYIRESRRLQAQFTLTENHMAISAYPEDAKWGEDFDDSVGCALYAVDIHPTKGEPPLLVRALPYHIPLGAFLPRYGPTNLLPAAKNFGATRLALASARMHPTEWMVGEVAGTLAAFCIERGIDNAALVRESPDLLREFQDILRGSGITLHWSEILPPENP